MWIYFFVSLLVVMLLSGNLRTTQRDRGKLYGLLVVIGAVAVLLLFYGYRGFYFKPPRTDYGPSVDSTFSIPNEYFYGIMFDAGSTGSRIHIFTFKSTGAGKPYKLVKEHFEQVKPGLSNYAENPAEAAASLKGMLDGAKRRIPAVQWAQTPVALKATAGLRLLSDKTANLILDEVRKLFKSYPFKMYDEAVAIMDGDDEGIFSWFTVNFLKGTIADPADMIGVMDLGGGSTQVTFVPLKDDTKNKAPKDHMSEVKIFDKTYQLYTNSYLGLGLMSARYQILGGREKGSDDVPAVMTSVCMDEGATDWKHKRKTISVRGEPPKSSRYEECSSKVLAVIRNSSIFSNEEIRKKTFVTISYYFDRANEAGLIVSNEDGAKIPIEYFRTAAKKACTQPRAQHPFLCLDLTYISHLLNKGFGLDWDTPVQIYKKIHRHEISWALGAMFKLFNAHPDIVAR